MISLRPTGSGRETTFRIFQVAALVVIVLAFAAADAPGGAESTPSTTAQDPNSGDAERAEEIRLDADGKDETVTMSIDLEEGGVIDVDVARGNLVVNTWDGDEVLVIVERKSKTGPEKPRNINFKVSRLGNNVRIAALDDEGKRVSGVDLSYRIMVPKDRQAKKVDGVYDLSRLTSVIFKALHREALNWLMR